MDDLFQINIRIPEVQSELHVVEGFVITFSHPKPNIWWRWWQYFFFGFKWKDINRGQDKIGL